MSHCISMNEYLVKKRISVVSTWLFPVQKNEKVALDYAFLKVWKNPKDYDGPAKDFQHCLDQWEQHLYKCVAFQGNFLIVHELINSFI